MAGEPESLDTDEALEPRRKRHWFDRLIMLSDGVFAIAITLLAFTLHIPETWKGLPDLLASIAPQLDAYALSFIVISVYWLAHRRFIAMILEVDAPVTVLNLVVLALVALLPAATELVHAKGPQQILMLLYGGLVVAIGTTLALLWGYAALIADLVSPEVSARVRWFYLILMVFTPAFFLALISRFSNPRPGVVPLCLVSLFLIGWLTRLQVLKWLTPAAQAVTPPPEA